MFRFDWEEPAAVLGLEPGVDDGTGGRRGEEREQRRLGPLVHASVVAEGGLDGRRELHTADVARLLLRLEAEVQHPADPPGQDAEDADLGLLDDRLVRRARARRCAAGRRGRGS